MVAVKGDIAVHRTAAGFVSKYAAALDMLMRAGDVAIVVAAGIALHWLRFHTHVHPPYAIPLVRAALLTLLVFPACGLYRSWRGASLLAELLRIGMAWSAVMGLLLMLQWALQTTNDYSRLWTAGWFAAALLLLAGSRLLGRGALRIIRAHGLDTRRLVLVGATPAAAKVMAAIGANPGLGLEVQGYVATPYDSVELAAGGKRAACLGQFDAFLASLRANPPDKIWVALPLRAEAMIQRLLEATADIPTSVNLVPDLFGYELINHGARSFAGVPVITLRGSRVVGHARVVKAIEDRLLAALFLTLLSPLMVLIAAAVKLSSPGPAIYRQKRHGLGGREIEVWKFRSMRVHAEHGGKVTQATENDPRVTAVGRFLRASSLDELPQLINVLQGRMSIVGPRPHAVQHNREFSEQLRGYMQRHGVKPGMTGLAQIRGFRGETDTLDKMARRVECDVEYIRIWSLWLDLKVILCTPLALLKQTNAY